MDDNNLDYHGQHELEDAGAQMSHGDIPNYASVLDHAEDAKIELDRYRREGFLVDVDKETVSKEMAHGTISKLGLIIKQKPEGVKRRIILDLRRSGGNKKSQVAGKNLSCPVRRTPSTCSGMSSNNDVHVEQTKVILGSWS